ncbi:hypothetical protein E4U42_000864 [Claviceps africana]|uniref:AMP-activated protein kinase glycogen-binding domain-containing protein n=1 Tax=Claviceps africana TaxID=83212 RepID=A0A8K0JAE8_9HYPO|nr:hypothetical protein E4U42_000864 [Claviceps africana]
MGSFTFKWADPTTEPSDVLVTGSFDGWTKSVTLEKDRGVFQKTIDISEKDAANKIYYKFVVDDNWVINESYPHEADHQGNLNNFLTAEDLLKPTLAPGSSPVSVPFLNTVTPESTTVAEMGKKNNKKNKADEMPASEPPTAAAAAPSPEVAGANQAVATPSDVPGGFPATPSNDNGTPLNEGADLENKTVSVNPLPATAGLGNPIELAPGEKIPDSITAQNIDDQVKLDKASYEESDALPTAPAVAAEVPSETDIANVAINSVGADATTATLAGQVPVESEQSAVPDVVKESQDKAGDSTEASAGSAEVKDKAEVQEEIKNVVPEAPATSVGTADAETEKAIEKPAGGVIASAAATGSAAMAAVAAAVSKLSDGAKPAVSNATAATAEIIDNNLPDSVKESLPAAAQDALASENKESTVDDVSPQVPNEVQESIAAAGESPEAAVNDSAVSNKEAVENELLNEVKEAPAVSDAPNASESVPVAETEASATAPVASKSVDVEPVVETSDESKPSQEEPAEVKPVDEAPAEVKTVDETPAEVKAVDDASAEVKAIDEAPAEAKTVDETPAEVKVVDEAPAEVKPVDETPAETQDAAPTTTSTAAVDETTAIPPSAAAAAPETETSIPEPSTAASANENTTNTNASDSLPVDGSTVEKKKNRFSIMFDKIKAKLK